MAISSFTYSLVVVLNSVQGAPIYAESLKVCEANAHTYIETIKKDPGFHSVKTLCLPLFEARDIPTSKDLVPSNNAIPIKDSPNKGKIAPFMQTVHTVK